MPTTITKRLSVWTGRVDCGRDTLMIPLCDNIDYHDNIVC